MAESNFPFIRKTILRQNIDEIFNHIVILLSFVESENQEQFIKSAFRKTIIIHTASIIEALLFYIIDIEFSEERIAQHYSTWKCENIKDIYKINEKHKIIAGEYIKKKGNVKKDKMNLGGIVSFLQDKKIINKELSEKIHIIRRLRNEQHIGTHKSVKKYSNRDLEIAFSVASDVKKFVAKRS